MGPTAPTGRPDGRSPARTAGSGAGRGYRGRSVSAGGMLGGSTGKTFQLASKGGGALRCSPSERRAGAVADRPER